MKLTHLIEGRHEVARGPYTLEIDTQESTYKKFTGPQGAERALPMYVSFHADIKEYDTFVSDPHTMIRSMVEDLFSVMTVNHPDKIYTITNFTLTDHLNGGGSTILLGKQSNFIKSGGRMIVMRPNRIEESIENFMSTLKDIKYPSSQECMTKIKTDHNLVKVMTRMYDVKDINIELHLTPKVFSISNIILNSTPEGKDEESIGLELARALKPYKIRPQINGGIVFGDR